MTELLADPVFYLGTPEPSWLWRAQRMHLYVSHRRLARLSLAKRYRRATTAWALDSGGYSELDVFGGWQTTAVEYAIAVARYDDEIGGMEWAAPQDWMCEPQMRAKTGLSQAEHQARSVASYFELTELWPVFSDASCPFIPVLQADPDSIEGYLACIERFRAAGLDFAACELVGIGSVCRQEDTAVIERTVAAIAEALPGVPLHGFGVKRGGLRRIGHLVASADSQAWSFGARKRDVRLPACEHPGACTWCPRAAMAWRDGVRSEVTPWGTAAWLDEFGPASWADGLPGLGERGLVAA